MTLKGIIAISGRQGLFNVIAQGKNNIIVESLTDKKRFPAYATDRLSALEDISIYTYEDDKPLVEIFEAIFDKEGGKKCISHKESANKLSEYLVEVVPNYDQERVYTSDIKKIFQWYNQLIESGLLKKEEVKENAPTANSAEESEEKKPAAKKPAAKKTTAKPADKKPTNKKAPAKTASAKAKAPVKKASSK
jgi:hypothetical protein